MTGPVSAFQKALECACGKASAHLGRRLRLEEVEMIARAIIEWLETHPTLH